MSRDLQGHRGRVLRPGRKPAVLRPVLSTATALALLLTGCSGGTTDSHIDTYTVGQADTELVVRYVTGPSDQAFVRVTSQGRESVTVEVKVTGPGGERNESANSLGQPHEDTLRLIDPLGSRKVLNADGTVVARAD